MRIGSAFCRLGSASLSVLAALAAMPAMATGLYSGSITAMWSTPVLTGLLIDAATAATVASDNKLTAVCNLSGCPLSLSGDPASEVNWGSGTAALNHSVVEFVGSNFTDVAANQVFELGRLTYTNGSSGVSTLIHGATLMLQATSGGLSITDAMYISLKISTTINSGNAAQNADFLDFGTSTFGTAAPVSFNVLEGMTATAMLYGSIVGDPQLMPVDIRLDPASTGAGFIGNGLPVPEPATGALMVVGMLAVGWATRGRRFSHTGRSEVDH